MTSAPIVLNGPGTAVVVGFGVTGRAVVTHLVNAGWKVTVVENSPTEALTVEVEACGAKVGPVDAIAAADLVVPSPGVDPTHPAYARAREAGVMVMSEVELAWQAAPSKRLVAVTGTNGKTTVVTLIEAMLSASGTRALAAGNIGLPLIAAVNQDVDVVVAEVSSFQLAYTLAFHPEIAVWLNLAPDHLDWHVDMEDYAAAKRRIWANQGASDIAVVNRDDRAVMAAAVDAPGELVTFGAGPADWSIVNENLHGPMGDVMAVADLPRSFPHDLSNVLAAMAAAAAAGASPAACAAGAAALGRLPHRVQFVGEAGGVKYYDDSKATTPASVHAALLGFESVVLIAGGRNKGLDLRLLAVEGKRLRAVVAIGEAAREVQAAFAGTTPVTVAESMREAVRQAAAAALPGDVVLLSPACASYDWYRSYVERGDDFVRNVQALVDAS